MGASRSVLRSLVALGALVFGVGCPGEKGGVGADSGEGETDTDTEPDTYSDTGSDTDTDTQTDSDSDTDTSPEEVDADGDGYPASEDCDDTNPEVYENETDIMALGIGPDCADMVVSARRYGEQEEDGLFGGGGGGDINGDGYDDVLMSAGAWRDDAGTIVTASYVVLGPMTGDQSLATADARIQGVEDWIGFGSILDGLGDVDSDGYDDFIASRSLGESDIISTVFMGPIAGNLLVNEADGIWLQAPYSGAGYARSAGDVDGDDLPDLTYTVDGGSSGVSGVGLVLGPLAGDHTLAEEVAFVGGMYSGDLCWPSGLGDTDGDGVGDLAVVCRYSSGGLFLGPLVGDQWVVDGDATFSVPGLLVKRAGDTNGDGYADLTLSAPQATTGSDTYQGVVFQYHGPIRGPTDPYADADLKLVGEIAGDYAAIITDGADLNGDGLDDTLVGAALTTYTGAVYSVLSPQSGTTSLSDAWWKVTGDSLENCSSVVDSLGDTDGDGYEDVLLGQLYTTIALPGDGAFYLLRGGS